MYKPSRILAYIQIPLFVIWFALAVSVYSALPERIPVHFDLSGTADGFANRSWWSWYLLPLVALGSCVWVVAVARWTASHPERWNVPHKAKVLALTPAERQPLTDLVELMLVGSSLAVTIVLALIHYQTWLVATGRAIGLTTLTRSAIFCLIGLVVLAIPAWLIAFNRRLKGIVA